MTTFTPFQAILGGAMIGIAAIALMATLGRIAGISGIVGSLLPPKPVKDISWRIAFLVGLISSGLVLRFVFDYVPEFHAIASPGLTLLSGLVVGIAVTFSSGCTSGHGVCGLARLSRRSIAATGIFMVTAAITVYFMKHA